MGSRPLTVPEPGREAAEAFVANALDGLYAGAVSSSGRFRGGQRAADAALAAYDVSGYAARRNQVLPVGRRGASQLSPWIRHGLLRLTDVWDHVDGGPRRDVTKFRDELLWQEYARHWYARLGVATRHGTRRELVAADVDGPGWRRDMACLDAMVAELHDDGWVVNQARMWLASHWSVREGQRWQDGEDRFFRHLLDGSRAANRLGWQWTTGVGSNRTYGFSRWQVEKRAPELCRRCPLADACPIEDWPDDPAMRPVDRSPLLRHDPDPDATAGPSAPVVGAEPEAVWLTAESLATDEPALAAHPDRPAVFVFDEGLLRGLGLAAPRLVFLVETLAELAADRLVELWRGDPAAVLAGRPVAVTFAPVPGFRRLAADVRPVAVHPWPWLRRPGPGTVASFSAWRREVARS